MFAVAEAFKLLAGYAGQQLEATLIEFDGYACSGARVRSPPPRRRRSKPAAPARPAALSGAARGRARTAGDGAPRRSVAGYTLNETSNRLKLCSGVMSPFFG